MSSNSEARKRHEEADAAWPRLTWGGVGRQRVLGKTADGEWCFVNGLGALGVGRMWQKSQFCTLIDGFDTDVILEKRGSVIAVPEGTPDTITITISRATAEGVVHDLPEASADFAFGRVALACRAALEGEK